MSDGPVRRMKDGRVNIHAMLQCSLKYTTPGDCVFPVRSSVSGKTEILSDSRFGMNLTV